MTANGISLAEYQAQVWRAMSEAQFQAQVMALAKQQGWAHIYHTHDSRRSQAGYPDLHMLRGERSLFAELKRMGRKPTPAQDSWLSALREAGHEAYSWRPCDMPEIERVLGGTQ